MTDWTIKDGYLVRAFSFEDFDEAFTFMQRVAKAAQKQNHHPNWTNDYNQVVIRLNTHDEDGDITAKDYALAEAINEIYSSDANT